MSVPQETVAQCSMPLPPLQYVALYSDENIRRGLAPGPPPPVQGPYVMFGRTINPDDPMIQPLESQGIKRLYLQNCDKKAELKKINHSLVMNFIDLLDILITAPESEKRLEKLDDIRNLFIQMHHLVNEYRPHQAREAVQITLESQLKQRKETIVRLREATDQACSKLREATESLPKIEQNAELLEMMERVRKLMEPEPDGKREQLREKAGRTNRPLRFRKIGSLRKFKKAAAAENSFHKLVRYRRRAAYRQKIQQRANQQLMEQHSDQQVIQQQETEQQANQLAEQQQTEQFSHQKE